jgi:hypothetical protein
MAQFARRSACLRSASAPDVPLCADLWSASVVVLSRRSVLLYNAPNRRFGLRLLPQPLRWLRAQIDQLGVSGIRAPAAHSCKDLVARSVLSPPLRAGPAWSPSRLDRGSASDNRWDSVQTCRPVSFPVPPTDLENALYEPDALVSRLGAEAPQVLRRELAADRVLLGAVGQQ